MFRSSNIPEASWVIVKSDSKKQARINSMRFLLNQFDYPEKNAELLDYDRKIVRSVAEDLGND